MTKIALAALVLIGVSCASSGQPPASWPSRTVRLITPLAAGGGPDLVARTAAEALARRWKQPVIVDNRPGGDGIVAVRAAIDAADDHTLLFSPNSVVTANPVTRPSLPYAADDLMPIASLVDVPIAIVTGAPRIKSLQDLLGDATRNPGTLAYTSVFGSPQLMWAAMLKDASIDMSHVGYRNPNVAIPDLLEQRVHAALLPLGTVLGPVRAGNLRVLAVLSSRRSGIVPDAPTIAEAGYPDYTADGALGLFAVRGRASERRDWIATEVQAVVMDDAVRKQLLQAGFEVRFAGPAAYTATLAAERARLGAVRPAITR